MGRCGVSSEQYKAINDIINCRTSKLGEHIDECGHIQISRNRHCPKCQTFAIEKWIDARKEDLVPVLYFHSEYYLKSFVANSLYS